MYLSQVPTLRGSQRLCQRGLGESPKERINTGTLCQNCKRLSEAFKMQMDAAQRLYWGAWEGRGYRGKMGLMVVGVSLW